ncbi:MAG: tRNA uridine-5-carboxymethylaminomethyl(34) synthesis GTPase MnmE [Rubripirellula sp.]
MASSLAIPSPRRTDVIEAEDTIVAIASPTSPAARGVVRLSGSEVTRLLESAGVACPSGTRPSRFESTIDIGEPIGAIPVSVLLWPSTRSYTGQPSAELHTIGSLPLLTGLVDKMIGSGARAARPGEFTMRSLLAGRLDLTQAEAVLGVIEAEQRGSLDHALRQLAGNLSRPLEAARGTLLDLLADVEAGLDFVDEDIEFVTDEALIERLSEIQIQLEATFEMMQSRRGGAARAVIALRGEPNAGKSCLLNRLAGEQVAIVADVAGTTRDTVTTEIEIDGHPVQLVDTAGLEEATSDVSRHSQQQADRASEEADLRLWCVDASRPDFESACERLMTTAAESARRGVQDLWVVTKSDLGNGELPSSPWCSCSAQSGQGMDQLRNMIREALSDRDREETGSIVGTAARCSQSLRGATEAISQAIASTRDQAGHEFVAAELRIAAQSLGEVTGTVYTDDILDRVFGRFCIGK